MSKLPDEQARGGQAIGSEAQGGQSEQRVGGEVGAMPARAAGLPPGAAMLAAAPAIWHEVELAKIRAKCLEMALMRPRAQDRARPLVIADQFWAWIINPNAQATDVDPIARQEALRAAQAPKAAAAAAASGQPHDWSHLNRD